MHKFTTVLLVNASRIVHIGPCVLVSATLSGDGDASDCDIYNGVNANAERKSHLEVISGTTFHLDLDGPALFSKGIFVVVANANGFVTIEYEPISDAELIVGHFLEES